MALTAEDIEEKYNEGIRQLQSGDVSHAQQTLETVLHALPDNPIVLERIGYCYALQEKWHDAEKYFRKASTLAPQNTEILNNLGCILQKQHKWNEAASYFSRAYTENADNTKALINLAICLQAEDKKNEAIIAYQNFIDQNPNDIAVRENLARLLYETGEYELSRQHYCSILEHSPTAQKAGISIMLAICCFALKSEDKALEHINSIAASQTDIEFTLHAQGQEASAKRHHLQASHTYGLLSKLQPGNSDFLNSYIFNLYTSETDNELVEKLLVGAIIKFPDDPIFPKTLSLAYGQAGITLEALDAAKLFVQNAPHDPKAHIGYGSLHVQSQKLKHRSITDPNTPRTSYLSALELYGQDKMGCIVIAHSLTDLKEPEFVEYFCEALNEYDYHEILDHFLKGYIALSKREFEASKQSFEIASTLAPESSHVHTELASALYYLGQIDEALQASYRSIELNSGNSSAMQRHATLLTNCGKLDEGLAANIKTVEMNPNNPDFRFSLGIQYLLRGNWKKGWPLYSSRLKFRYRNTIEVPPVPQWDGTPSDNLDLVICPEQGLGDIIQFARFIPMVADSTGRTFVTLRKNLCHMFTYFEQNSDKIKIIEEGSNFSVSKSKAKWCPLMDLPFILDLDESKWSHNIPYIFAQQDQVREWKNHFNTFNPEAIKIGIAWQGNPNQDIDLGRSIPLHYFKLLSEVKNIQLVSLQKEHGLEQLKNIDFLDKIHLLGDDFDSGKNAFADTINVMETLDLIITSDTSIAHVAGALGRPVWLGLRFCSEWRWQFEREDSPWYPTMRIFRQHSVGDWHSAMNAMAQDLNRLVNGDKSVLKPKLYKN
ncbi:MAG: tetratricopeptide repeat protein [Pseudomonadota bacterium]